MKVYFVRHGEAMDDVEDCYGGWADYPLSPKGIKQALNTGQKLADQGTGAEIILTSSLLRAKETAEEISKVLELPVEEFVYLKERNTYGLLCGVNKDEAKEKYPELVKAYEGGRPVLGYEAYDFFLERVRKLIELLLGLGYETVICVTHGKLLKALLEDVAESKKVARLGDGCIVEVTLDKKGHLEILDSEGVVFESV